MRLVRTTDGTQLSYQSFNSEWRCTQIKDRNGDYITVNYDWLGHIANVVDTLARTIAFNYDTNNNLLSITQTWTVNGSPTTHTWASFGWTTKTIQPSFSGVMVVGANPSTIPVISQVGLDDGSRWARLLRSTTRSVYVRNLLSTVAEFSLPQPTSPDCSGVTTIRRREMDLRRTRRERFSPSRALTRKAWTQARLIQRTITARPRHQTRCRMPELTPHSCHTAWADQDGVVVTGWTPVGFVIGLLASGAANQCLDDDCGANQITVIARNGYDDVIGRSTLPVRDGDTGWDGSLDDSYRVLNSEGSPLSFDSSAEWAKRQCKLVLTRFIANCSRKVLYNLAVVAQPKGF
jgi:hypothetical protein